MNEPAMNSFASPSPAAYTVEVLSEMTGISRQSIVQYEEHGLIQPQFDDDTVRILRRMEHLRESYGMNFSGVKLITTLLEEVERLRADLRARR